ncbi:helix-turn-helix domain-containing protein [Extibacter muris]|uniref:Helix-turn-helix domain-containing protein n=1 Tax=Extibacter muris TaxID=1796622 RepID=A0A4R4FAD2_9FIRM|nr:helix-turn-helix domain-containing protein [Extibacter muris]MCU0080609.1 helix-turn-helix domain-containing protein [Extibacter muris]TDA20258.1 helix-turn-helix domain-containing protein [Extibacter muris]
MIWRATQERKIPTAHPIRLIISASIRNLLRYRIQKSLSLLVSDTYTITEIANQVGFSGSSYYSEVFRKYMHCSPREYKKNTIK